MSEPTVAEGRAQAVLGDWVRTPHGYRGRVYAIHHSCPESDEWLALQVIQPTASQLEGKWASVLCDGGGSVCHPAEALEILPHPIKGFRHPFASMYFREVMDV